MNDDIISRLPHNVDDNQQYIDSDGNIWKYDQQTESWDSYGPLVQSSLASEISSGLLSPQYKLLLDTISQFPGAFGIIVDKPTKQLIQGNVKFISNSLDINCFSANGNVLDSNSGCGDEITVTCGSSSDVTRPSTLPRFVIKLNADYLAKLCIDLPAPRGKTGKKGDDGIVGESGFSDGPKGMTGLPGPNVDQLLTLRNVVINDVSTLSNNPIVNLEIVDRQRGPYLRCTKSQSTLRVNECAQRLLVTPIIRNVVFSNELTDGCKLNGMDNWIITKTNADTLPENVFLLRLSDTLEDSCSTFTTISLQEYVEALINKYESDIVEYNKTWSLKVKAHIDAIDTEARAILSELANDLAMCESELPATEWGLVFEKCASSSPAIALKLSADKGNVDSMLVSGKKWDLIV